MTERTATLFLENPQATEKLARCFAPLLRPGDVLLLSGAVGAGKTHFARQLILASLQEQDQVPSPTYTLVQTYDGQNGEIWHADLYRLFDIGEIEELGLSEAFETAICLVEWPDRLGVLAPANALHFDLQNPSNDDTRALTFRWSSHDWDGRVSEVQNGFA